MWSFRSCPGLEEEQMGFIGCGYIIIECHNNSCNKHLSKITGSTLVETEIASKGGTDKLETSWPVNQNCNESSPNNNNTVILHSSIKPCYRVIVHRTVKIV